MSSKISKWKSQRGPYLSTPFWAGFDKDFEFSRSFTDELSDPEAAGESMEVRDSLIDALSQSHAPSPSERKTDKLEKGITILFEAQQTRVLRDLGHQL